MKKRLAALALVFTFVMSIIPTTYALTLSQHISNAEVSLGLTPGTLSNQTVNVDTDISLKFNGDADYVNGALVKDASSATVDLRAEIDMAAVVNEMLNYRAVANDFINATAVGVERDDLQAEIDAAYVSPDPTESWFTVTINYPANFTITDPDFIDDPDGNEMKGFSLKADATELTELESKPIIDQIYEEVDRDVDTTNRKITIKINIRDNVTLDVLEQYLSDSSDNPYNLVLTCTGNELSGYGTYHITGSIEGQTTIKSTHGQIGKVVYTFIQKPDAGVNKYVDPENPSAISGTVKLQQQTGGGVTIKYNFIVITDAVTGEKTVFRIPVGTKVKPTELAIPKKLNHKFDGLYYDPEFTQPVEDTIVMNKEITTYVKWIPADKTDVLERDAHLVYVIGYPIEDGIEEVRPENNITREEIATIYYRLLKTDVRDTLFTNENDFTDVEADRWSNKAISTMANGGYINGYEDNSFKPGNAITRAEFVTICARIFGVDENTEVKIGDFADTKGHWASTYIRYASENSWLEGYGDGTFKPEQHITRAEVMKIINNMLNRHVKEEGLVEDAKRWIDNSPDAWYYYEVIEATNAHSYERTEGEDYETWKEILVNNVLVDKPQYEDAE